jgi:hypothetical protein
VHQAKTCFLRRLCIPNGMNDVMWCSWLLNEKQNKEMAFQQENYIGFVIIVFFWKTAMTEK